MKIKGKEYKGSRCCSSCFDDYRSIIRYKDKTGIRIYIGEEFEESYEKLVNWLA